MGQTDGAYLCNSPQQRSAIAFYNNFGPSNFDNQQPDSLVYTSNGTDFIWEGKQQSFTFSSGVTLTFNIDSDGAKQPTGTQVGSAQNGFESFGIFRSNAGTLVTDNDGVELQVVYTLN